MREDDLLQRPIFGRSGRIAAVIEELGVTQEAFGRLVGRSRETVNGWVSGRQTTDRRSARRIAELARERLELDVQWVHFHEPTNDPLDEIRLHLERIKAQLQASAEAVGFRSATTFQPLLQIVDPTPEERELLGAAANELEAMAETNTRLANALRAKVG